MRQLLHWRSQFWIMIHSQSFNLLVKQLIRNTIQRSMGLSKVDGAKHKSSSIHILNDQSYKFSTIEFLLLLKIHPNSHSIYFDFIYELIKLIESDFMIPVILILFQRRLLFILSLLSYHE